ncbi:type II toxin-antitoxin system HicB family antitoxin (plasmid) [Pseudomonas luteola]
MKFPIAIEWGDETTATGIQIPDIPGAVTAGDTLEEAYDAAIEVAHIMLEDLAKRGEDIPMPSPVEKLRKLPDYEGMGWGMLEIDVTPYLGKAEKVNVTLPGVVIRRIDRYVEQHGIRSRSNFLAQAALEKLEHHVS